MAKHLFPTSEVDGSNPGSRYCKVGQKISVQNLDQLFALVSTAHKTTCRDMICILKATLKPK